MANKRAQNKRTYFVWIDKDIKTQAETQAKALGMTNAQFAEYAIKIALQKLQNEQKNG